MEHEQKTARVREPMPGVVYPDWADVERYVQAGALTHETLADGFRKIVEQYPDHVALAGLDLRMSYKELDELSTRLAGALLRTGLKPLDRVIYQLGDSPQFIIMFLACIKAGLIPVCTLAAHREREIGYLAQFAEAKLHVVQGDDPKFDGVAFARKMQESAPTLEYIMQVRGPAQEGVLHLEALIESISLPEASKLVDAVELDPFQVAVFQLSGGTTDVPKIIPRFHSEYLYNMRSTARWLGFQPDDVLFMPQPLVHNLNMACCFGPFLMTGGMVTIAPNLQPESLIALIKHTRPTWLMLGGPIIARLESAIASGEIDFSQARGIMTASGARKLREMLKVPVYTIFGMTEGVVTFVRPGDPLEAQDLTNGRPISEFDEIRILKPGTEEPVAPGETGEPSFKGPYTIRGYYKAEERNKDAFTSDGRYRSGDLMYEKRVDGRTYYVFCGRIKDLVSRGGEKINCEEVETAVAGHPAVAAVAAVPYPDPVYDERLCAVLILREGSTAPSVVELGKYLEGFGLAKYKWPERIEVVDNFPLTASGKLSKAALKEHVREQIQRQQANPSK